MSASEGSTIDIKDWVASAVRGEVIWVKCRSSAANRYAQMQVDFTAAGRRNKAPVVGVGTEPKTFSEGSLGVPIDLSSVRPGQIIELARIGFHTPAEAGAKPQAVWFLPGRDFPRHFVEVTESGAAPRSHDELREAVRQQERGLMEEFLRAWPDPQMGDPRETYAVVVFLRGILVTQPAYFDRWALFPGPRRDQVDEVAAVNKMLAAMPYQAAFRFSTAEATNSIEGLPHASVQFPALRAESTERAVAFAVSKVEKLLEALTYTRGASGEIFAVVTAAKDGGAPVLHRYYKPYRGNLLGGHLSGEDPETLEWLAGRIETDLQLAYFMQLYREARAENTVDYQYLRYWTLLEVIAESKSPAGNPALSHLNGTPVSRNGKPLRRASAPGGLVYSLLYSIKKETGAGLPRHGGNHIANRYTLWDYVRSWNALRTATAHFGGFRPDDPVQQKRFGGYADALRAWNDQGQTLSGFVSECLTLEAQHAIVCELRIRRLGTSQSTT